MINIKSENYKEISFSANNLKIYPNSSNGLIVVENKDEGINSKVIVSDLAGKIVFSKVINNKQTNEFDLQYLENGIYLLKVINKKNSEYSKIIITK
ncbi:MAG: hypothetical protein A3F72_09465 [Bacteroidetes bacterium RIFCSPLOWO2_12_FULL_35_15]|nr:MAG: hypothetical protein A3F72_09465 [Bacteroidetes bacterium RIFCSPLOWO2_12_FULL_35_15]